jgi:hypothetical protein
MLTRGRRCILTEPLSSRTSRGTFILISGIVDGRISCLCFERARLRAAPSRNLKESKKYAAPWKSGASSPRESPKMQRALAPVVVFVGSRSNVR